jgi:threonine dehydrogenase-like Zn-dependent dehydrogenase
MKQAVLVKPRASTVTQSEPPTVGKNEVLVRVSVCGVCASELHPWLGDGGPYPRRLGHEVAGTVEAVGREVTSVEPGMRVSGLFHEGFAEYAVAPEEHVIQLPDSLGWREAMGEPLACVLSAARRTPVEPGDTVAVVGLGFMGLLMLQLLAHAAPRRLLAIDVREEALEKARHFGAHETFHPRELPEELRLTSWDKQHSGHGVDVVVEASGSQKGLALAGEMTRTHGFLSILGYHQGGARTVDMQLWNWKALSILNAHERRPWYLMECMERGLALVDSGAIRIAPLVTHSYPLEEVDSAFHDLHAKPATFSKAIITM